jgi:hypothetical protein
LNFFEDYDKPLTAAQKAELKARIVAEKLALDRKLKRHVCSRCHRFSRETPVVARLLLDLSIPKGVIRFPRWLCRECLKVVDAVINELQDAKREAERPQREAEAREREVKQAKRSRELKFMQAEARARLNATRAEAGLPPILEPSEKPGAKAKKAPKKPGKIVK